MAGRSAWLLVAGMLAAPPAAAGRRAAQPVLDERSAPVLVEHGLRFRDLDRNGRIDPYEDWRLPIERRVADLVGRMTPAEKAGTMMHGSLAAPDSVIGGSSLGYDRPAARDAIARLAVTSFITRLSVPPERMANENNAIQAIAATTRLGIPVTISTDPRHHFQYVVGASSGANGYSQWPEPLGFAALGDAALVGRFAAIARREYRASGIHMTLSPQADLFTEPRWPRGTATFGADARLAGRLVAAYVEGFQGGRDGPARDGVAAVVKHWVGYGASPEGYDGHNRYGRIARLDDRALAVHAAPFAGAFALGVAGLMPTYDILEGPHGPDGAPLEAVGAGFSKGLLDLARDRYGFRGMILSDWGITRDCVAECRAPTRPQTPAEIATPWGVEQLSVAERFAKGIAAGIDQFGGVTEPQAIVDGVAAGRIAPARIDAAVARILTLKFRLGLFENAMADVAAARTVVSPATRAEALAVQARAQVLLKNDGGVLPLRPGMRVFLRGIDPALATAAGLRVVASPALAQVSVIRASTPFERLHPNHFFGSRQNEGRLDFRATDPDLIAVRAAAAAGPVVLALFLDRPAVLTEMLPSTRAILANFGIGDAALLDALTGRVAVAGRLPFELPSSMDAVRRQDPAIADDSAAPLFPRGYGLRLR